MDGSGALNGFGSPVPRTPFDSFSEVNLLTEEEDACARGSFDLVGFDVTGDVISDLGSFDFDVTGDVTGDVTFSFLGGSTCA